jgi:hypothetical protein
VDDLVDLQLDMLRRVRAMETRATPYFRWPPSTTEIPWTPVALGAGYSGSLDFALRANRWSLRFAFASTVASPAATVATLPPSVVLPGPLALKTRDNASTDHQALVAGDGTMTLDPPLDASGLHVGGYFHWTL